jgi:FAD synthetase
VEPGERRRLEEAPPEERVRAYIENVALALDQVREKERGQGGLDERARRLVELAAAYLDDARYYLEEKKDAFTALACIAYAEGLIDALRWLGMVEAEWRPTSSLLERPRVLVAGTFDIIHPGHVELFRQAWLRGRVYAVVARDESVRRFKKREPIVPETQRLETVQAIRYVYKAVLGSTRDVLDPIREIKPHIILLGPDQWASEDWLRQRLKEEGIEAQVERLPEKKKCPLCSTTAIACRAAKVVPPEACRDLDLPPARQE